MQQSMLQIFVQFVAEIHNIILILVKSQVTSQVHVRTMTCFGNSKKKIKVLRISGLLKLSENEYE
ncbi:hypothetical protein BpHYR1_038447 [Brachionus plicatilis]|uniref:Uncharacterized protein n=1 Tax=Brachionus plicatilis TaxID=10195 RepID=A0A3M7Q5I3_BRAPC|nr:hypothetical protein BpHYR1_038447 [Brachionus plicatilis]